MPRVRVDPGYVRARRRLPRQLQNRADATLVKFQENPKRPGLSFERLQGWSDLYSIRINRSYRILLRRESDVEGELYAAVDVGPHEVYRRK